MQVPINPDLMQSYRQELAVPDCPSFIDTKREITPIVDVSNKGILTVQTTTTAGAASDLTVNFNVPIGEVWEVYGLGFSLTGTQTIGLVEISRIMGSDTNTQYVFYAWSTTPSVGINYTYNLPQPIKIAYGESVSVYFKHAAFTSGNRISKVIYKKYKVGI